MKLFKLGLRTQLTAFMWSHTHRLIANAYHRTRAHIPCIWLQFDMAKIVWVNQYHRDTENRFVKPMFSSLLATLGKFNGSLNFDGPVYRRILWGFLVVKISSAWIHRCLIYSYARIHVVLRIAYRREYNVHCKSTCLRGPCWYATNTIQNMYDSTRILQYDGTMDHD